MSVDELVKALEEESPVNRAFKLAKDDVQAGTGATGGKAVYTKEMEGPELVDHLKHYAVDFYGGMRTGGNLDPEQLHHQLKQDLGDEGYLKLRGALKIGDRDAANNIAKEGLVDRYGAAKAGPIIEKISLLGPDERIAVGKELVTLVGGKDYAAASEHPDLILQTLKQQKALAARWN